MHQVHAQNDAPSWQGEVQVSPSTLTIREGEALSYNIRLSEQPAADGWWVRIHVDGGGVVGESDDGERRGGVRPLRRAVSRLAIPCSWDGACSSDPTSACSSRWISAIAPTAAFWNADSWAAPAPGSATRGFSNEVEVVGGH